MGALQADARMNADEYLASVPETMQHRELRGGTVVSFASPSAEHQSIVLGLGSEIRSFIKRNRGKCSVFIAPLDVRLDQFNVVQPDVFVVCDPSKMDTHCNGAPDWVIEVLSTNRWDDLVAKLHLYHEAGVREYWIVDPKKRVTLVYCFEQNDSPDIYTFDTPIPVGIYDKALTIRMEDLA